MFLPRYSKKGRLNGTNKSVRKIKVEQLLKVLEKSKGKG